MLLINHFGKDTINCPGKVVKISHFNQTNQHILSIYIKIELCYFSHDQWEIRIHLLWGKCFNIPHDCYPHLNKTKFNGLLPLTIDGVLMMMTVVFMKAYCEVEDCDGTSRCTWGPRDTALTRKELTSVLPLSLCALYNVPTCYCNDYVQKCDETSWRGTRGT